MNAPFLQNGFIDNQQSLFIALIIGIAFGFFLERGGLGNARKLTAQFYFTDMSVFKMMFSAIITAMLAIFWLSWFGYLEVSQLQVVPTYILPELIGGLIFGIGFVMGGYCPGTSCVALTTGRIDGIILLLGMSAGIFAFGESFPLIQNFYYSTSAGQLTFPQLFSIPYGMAVFIVVALALSAFYAAEKIEKKFSANK